MSDEEAPATEGQVNEKGTEDVELIIDDGTPQPSPDDGVPAEFKDVSKAQLVDRLKKVEADQAVKDKEASIFDRLGSTLEKIGNQPVPTAQAPQSPQEKPEELRERINQKSLESPADAMDEYFTHKMGPMVGQTLQGNLTLARKLMELDPERGPTFRKYVKDIDRLVESAPPQAKVDPTIYDRAYKQVIQDHIDEIIAEKVAAAVAKSTEKAPETPKPPSFSEGRGSGGRPGAQKQVRLSQVEAERLAKLGIAKEDMYNYGK